MGRDRINRFLQKGFLSRRSAARPGAVPRALRLFTFIALGLAGGPVFVLLVRRQMALLKGIRNPPGGAGSHRESQDRYRLDARSAALLALRCPYQRLGMRWLEPQPSPQEDFEGPCGRTEREAFKARKDYHFVGIGVQRAGTTALFERLWRHPSVVTSGKGTGFWEEPEHRSLDPSHAKVEFTRRFWYGLETVQNGQRRGEITPTYLAHPKVAVRLRRAIGLPLRFIVLLRDPVARAYSYYRMLKSFQTSDYSTDPNHGNGNGNGNGNSLLGSDGSFETAIEYEYWTIMRCRQEHNFDLSWFTDCYACEMKWVGPLAHGMYFEHLTRWFESFPPCSTLVLDRSDLSIDGVDSCLFAFLDMDPFPFDESDNRNGTSTSRSKWLQLQKDSATGTADGDGMAPETRRRLRELYKPHNLKLESMLGRKFEWGY